MSDVNMNNAGLVLSNAVADAVQRAAGYTVLVNARRRLPLSGVVFQAGMVLTADHGIEREEDIQVILADGTSVTASLAGRDRGSDLAVLRLNGENTAAQTAQPTSEEPRVGHLVLAVGRPSQEGVQASFGLITALGGGLHTHQGGVIERYIVADATPLPGFSGGPLVDLAGGMLGINTSGLVRGASLAIAAQTAFEMARNLAQHGHIKRGYLGIRSQGVEIPVQARAQLGRDQTTGLLVVGIEPEGPAAGANGLMVGDILVGLNGQPVSDHDDLMSRLVGDLVGRASAVQVLRGGQLQTVQLTIGERK